MDIKQIFSPKIMCAAVLLLMAMCQVNVCFAATPRKSVFVYMEDNYFSPPTITICCGQKVTWINKGHHAHNVVSKQGYFNSGTIQSGSRVSYTFIKPGVYPYRCTFHSFWIFGMQGKVIVK